jgi:CDP-diacylglycerol--glycerol-3-phosphate 3-phosphatidyltransferase
MNLPNWITVSRLVAVPIIFLSIEGGDHAIGVVAFVLACVTDWLDGFVARQFQLETGLGKILDPLVDKLLVLAPLLALVQTQVLPAWGVYVIVARELLVTAWRGHSAGGANLWGKAKTVLQMVAIILLLMDSPYGIYGFWLAVAVTIWSGITYILPTGGTLGSTADKTNPPVHHTPAPYDTGYGDQPATTTTN